MSGLVGHADAVATFGAALRAGRLHHAWLLAGPQGIGKARFADLAARRMLAEAAGPPPGAPGLEVAPGHPIAALLDAGSHPDFRHLARLPRDRSEDLARSITVDQVRALQPFFATTPSLSPRRVVVIDAADDLERSAANALLKQLEEPPAGTVFLLVSHAPGRLLPTIRSRCRMLRFSALIAGETRKVLEERLPEEDPRGLDALTAIVAGAPGAALRFAGLDVAGLDAAIDLLAREGDPTNIHRAALARALSGKAAQARYEAFLERVPARMARAAREARPEALGHATTLYGEARAIAVRALRQSNDPQLTVFELAGLVARLAPEEAPAKA